MRLLKIEWLKLKKYRTFYILSGLFLLIFLILNFAINKGVFNMQTSGGPMGKQSVGLFSSDYTFPQVYENVAFWYGFAIIFICVFVIINISNEFSFKTQRQSIIDGFSRMSFLHSKVVFIIGINIILTIVYFLVSITFGLANGSTDVFSGSLYTLHVFIYGLNYLSFAALITLFIKRSGLSIMILLAYVFFEAVGKHLVEFFTKAKIGKYLPLDCSDSLLPVPTSGLARMVQGDTNEKGVHIMLLMSGIYILCYYFIARWRMQKADL